MPSWPIHLSLANKLNKKLKLGNEFIIGNVLPDVLLGFEIENPSQIIDKNINHFQNKNKKPILIETDEFIKKYKDVLHNNLIKGYLAHLLADDYYNKYTYKYHTIITENGTKLVLKDGTIVTKFKEKPWQIKQKDFKLYGQKLINKSKLPKVDKITGYDVINESPITKDDLNKVIQKINQLQKDKQNYNSKNYILFTENELDKLFEMCYKHILNILKTL